MSNIAYQVITDRIVAALQQGIIPWRKPWTSTKPPYNAVSKKAYRGINRLVLGLSQYADPRWVSFKQCKDLGGNVRKGEKSTPVVFWLVSRKKDEQTGEERKTFVLRYYNVFNVEQCEGLKLPDLETVGTAHERIDEAERVAREMPKAPRIEHLGNVACYIPSLDLVRMPDVEQFHTVGGYYATLFHELAHATGHKSRLDRKGIMEVARFGDNEYSKEELVAELSSAFVSNAVGIQHDEENTTAYIQSWVRALNDDPKMVVNASGHAQRAADFILGHVPQEDEPADETQVTEG